MITIAWLLLLAGGSTLQFNKTELHVPGRVIAAIPADIDGDQQQEVLVFWQQGLPPRSKSRLSIYGVIKGKSQPKPKQILSIPSQSVAFDVADATADGLADVILIMADGIWILQGKKNGQLANKPTHLVRAMTLAAFANPKYLPRMSMFLSLGQKNALLVPTIPIGPLALYIQNSKGQYKLNAMLRVQRHIRLYTAAEDFHHARDFNAIFRFTIPRVVIGDQNADTRADLLFFQRDSVAIFHQDQSGSFPENPVYLSFGLYTDKEKIRSSTVMKGDAADFNGDGRLDLLFNKVTGGISNMKNDVWLFYANAKGGYSPNPSLAIHTDGFGASVQAVDIDQDGRADLIRPYVKMGIIAMTQVLLTGKIGVSFQLHLSQKGQPTEKPNASLSSSLAVNFSSNQELRGPYPILDQDFNGDGLNDALIGQAGDGKTAKLPDRLEIKKGVAPGRYQSTPIWSISLPATRHVLSFRQNSSQLPSLLVYFPTISSKQGDVWVLLNQHSRS